MEKPEKPLFESVPVLIAPCGCEYTLECDRRMYGDHKVVVAMCAVHVEQVHKD